MSALMRYFALKFFSIKYIGRNIMTALCVKSAIRNVKLEVFGRLIKVENEYIAIENANSCRKWLYIPAT